MQYFGILLRIILVLCRISCEIYISKTNQYLRLVHASQATNLTYHYHLRLLASVLLFGGGAGGQLLASREIAPQPVRYQTYTIYGEDVGDHKGSLHIIPMPVETLRNVCDGGSHHLVLDDKHTLTSGMVAVTNMLL